MEYTKKSFSVGALPSKEYRDSWERTFAREGKPALTPLGTCDHCKARDVDLHTRDRLYLCAKCAGLPPKVPTFWTCPDCGGTSSWGAEQLHRCAR